MFAPLGEQWELLICLLYSTHLTVCCASQALGLWSTNSRKRWLEHNAQNTAVEALEDADLSLPAYSTSLLPHNCLSVKSPIEIICISEDLNQLLVYQSWFLFLWRGNVDVICKANTNLILVRDYVIATLQANNNDRIFSNNGFLTFS